MQTIPVILYRGCATSLWPLCKTGVPEQFLVLLGPKRLFHR
jgi:mannose-1-phosphate guanylyltransferase